MLDEIRDVQASCYCCRIGEMLALRIKNVGLVYGV